MAADFRAELWRERRAGLSRSRMTCAVLVGLGLVKFVPYLTAGPGFLIDDWRFAYNVQSEGTWAVAHTGGATVRPGSFVAYALMFGASQSPVVLAGILATLNVAFAVVLYLVMRRWLPEWEATVAAGAWLLVPSHAGSDYWISGFGGTLALLLLGLGVLALIEAYKHDTSMMLPGVLIVTSVAVYELSILFAVVSLVAVPLLERKQIRWAPTLAAMGGIGVAGLVILAQTPYASRSWLDLPGVWALTFDLGQSGAIGTLVVGVISAGVLGVLARSWWRERRRVSSGPGRRLLVGLTLMGLGIAPALRFPLGIGGMGDRVNVAAAVGAGIVLAALLASVPRRGLMVAVVSVPSLIGGYTVMGDYVAAGDDGRAWIAQHRHGGIVDEADLPEPRGGVFSLCCDYVTTSAVRVVTGRHDVEVRVVG